MSKKDLTTPNKPDNEPTELAIKPRKQGKTKGRRVVKRTNLPEVTPEELDHVRRHVLSAVKDNIPMAKAVLQGDLRWTNQQVKLFQLMLNKVMPDLSHKMNEHIHHDKPVEELTREELEKIVARSKKADEEESSPSSAILEDDRYQTIKDEAIEVAVEEFKKHDK